MRLRLALLSAAALLTLAACGSDEEPSAGSSQTQPPSTAAAPTLTPTPTPTPTPSQPAKAKPATAAQIQSTIDDVQSYAPAMEQVYFDQGYPKDLAGALRTAKQLTFLKLSQGNTIASYVFDPSDQEFQLCIENTSGAWAVYDTSPMSTTSSGKSGGCP
ncbi:heme-binding NEAT domain protein [Marmoricola sp. OAE513]|uniref:hypothetical protein n=1 Tax=Marmoricola sp. OAE513 TaxID=2817894 RepID=UPI001AE36471